MSPCLHGRNQRRRARQSALSDRQTFSRKREEHELRERTHQTAGPAPREQQGRASGAAAAAARALPSARREGRAGKLIRGNASQPTHSVLSQQQEPRRYLRSTDGGRSRETRPPDKGNRFQGCNFNRHSIDPQPRVRPPGCSARGSLGSVPSASSLPVPRAGCPAAGLGKRAPSPAIPEQTSLPPAATRSSRRHAPKVTPSPAACPHDQRVHRGRQMWLDLQERKEMIMLCDLPSLCFTARINCSAQCCSGIISYGAAVMP